MNSLRDMQRAFKQSIFSKDSGDIDALVREDGIPASQRAQIYRNNCRIGFHSALAATYPVIEKLGGSDWFKQSAREFQLAYPSRCGDLQYVGERYTVFLQDSLHSTDYHYFADVARLEWAYQEVLVAKETSPLDPTLLAQVSQDDYEKLVFVPRGELRLVSSPFPVLDIWKAHQPNAELTTYHIQFDRPTSNILLIRRNDHVELRELPLADFVLLQHFMDGATLGMAAEAVSLEGFDLGTSLRNLMSLQTIHEFHIGMRDQN